MASHKINPGKIAGIIFCLITIAAAVAVIVASAELRACRKALDIYINGVSRASWASRSVIYEGTRAGEPELTDLEEQKNWFSERYGRLPGYDGNGVRVSYKITEFSDLNISRADVKEAKYMLLDVTCKGGGKEEKAEVMATFFKVGGKWYLVDDFLGIDEQPEKSVYGDCTNSAFYMGEKILLTGDNVIEIFEALKDSMDIKYEIQLALSDNDIRDYMENGCYISIDFPEEREFTIKGYDDTITDSNLSVYISDKYDSVISVGSHYYSLKSSACKALLTIAQSAEVIPDERYISSVTYKNIIFDLNSEGSKAILNLIDDSFAFNNPIDLYLTDEQIESYRGNGLYICVANPDMEDTLVLIDGESAYIRAASGCYLIDGKPFLDCLGVE